MKKILLLNFVFTLLLFASCNQEKSKETLTGGDTLQLRYARNLVLVKYDSCSVAILRNPWDTTKILHSYVLVDKHSPLPANLPEGTLVRTPLRKAVVYSSVHCSLLYQLGVLSSVKGVCDLNYIKMSEVQKQVKNGRMTDYGEGLNPNLEKIMDTHPDALMPSPFENSGGYGRLEKLDIPIIECADYMELSPLGRAEWMLFYGLLFGCENRADSLFTDVERNYLNLKQLTEKVSTRPSLLSELRSGASWYVPGGSSTQGQLYKDAGAEYKFSEYKQSGSVALSFETVFDRAQGADFWLIKYNQPQDMTYTQLQQDYSPYSHFKAFEQRNIYGCNTNRVPYYEEITFHPDLLLADLIRIFHPHLLPSHKLRYFCKLK